MPAEMSMEHGVSTEEMKQSAAGNGVKISHQKKATKAEILIREFCRRQQLNNEFHVCGKQKKAAKEHDDNRLEGGMTSIRG